MRSAGRAAATTGEPSRGAASQQRARERRARTTESRAGHDQSKVVESDGGRAHIPLSFQLDTPLCQVNATREKEPQHATAKPAQQRAHTAHLASWQNLSGCPPVRAAKCSATTFIDTQCRVRGRARSTRAIASSAGDLWTNTSSGDRQRAM